MFYIISFYGNELQKCWSEFMYKYVNLVISSCLFLKLYIENIYFDMLREHWNFLLHL